MKIKRIIAALLLAFLMALALVPGVSANAAEPPQLTVVVSFAPEDLSLSLTFDNDGTTQSLSLEKIKTAWESQYRVRGFRIGAYGNVSRVRLVAATGEKTLEFSLPEEALTRYNNVYSLNLKSESLSDGLTPGRSAALVSLRVGLTLILEALVFYAFGFREKRSWTLFLTINLITQGALNIALDGALTAGYLLIALFFYEIMVMIVELIGFLFLIREHKRLRTALGVIAANLLSLGLGGLLISRLPV